MKAVARVLGVSRSNLIERLRVLAATAPAGAADSCPEPTSAGGVKGAAGLPARRSRPLTPPSTAADDALVERIRAVIDTRPSYGYRPVTTLLNRREVEAVNHKRVYRVMRDRDLLLERHTGRPRRIHDGVIITLKSDLRWCSDAFEIRCWSGERVQVAFALDCCDREVLSFVATTGAITGEMIRDLMAESVEYRFGAGTLRTPHAIEWLSDNGPPYTAGETRSFAEELGLLPCTTPPYSPESNGMAEAFVKSFKRDYVYVGELHDAASVLASLAAWFEDYNEIRPHRGLRMRSPREYRRLTAHA